MLNGKIAIVLLTVGLIKKTERVLTNLWLYRLRLGQPSPSLDQAAAGGWPVYAPVERSDGTMWNASRL